MYCTIDYGDRAVRSPPRDEDAPFRIALLPCDVLALLRLRLEAPPSFFPPLELLLFSLVVGRLLLSRSLCRLRMSDRMSMFSWSVEMLFSGSVE